MDTTVIEMVAWAAVIVLFAVMILLMRRYSGHRAAIAGWKYVAFAVPGLAIVTIALLTMMSSGDAANVGKVVAAPSCLWALELWFILYALFAGRPACNTAAKSC